MGLEGFESGLGSREWWGAIGMATGLFMIVTRRGARGLLPFREGDFEERLQCDTA